jgi:ribosomal-protein-alanine N-acetyltransferase
VMTPELESARLLLRPLQLADAAYTQILFPHWEIVQFLNQQVPWPYPVDGAHSYYKNFALPAVERGDEWHWSLFLKSDPEQFIGSIGLFKGEENNRGFWIGLPWQRRGFASEASVIVTDFWFDVLKFERLRIPKAIANTGSRRISEIQNMRVVVRQEREFVSGRLPAEIWEITADEWHALRHRI